nr:LOW QUALITY PROTEIN: uncharacterized protein LOC117856485 [Setaria viridis]
MAYLGGGEMSTVNAILAEAVDLIALEQIAKLNTAHVADNSALPSSLESCFRKLKSLLAPFAAAPVRSLDRSVTAPHPTLLDPPRPHPPHEQPLALAPVAQDEHPPGDAAATEPMRPPATVPAAHDDDEDEDLERLFGSGRRGRPMLRERNRGRDDGGDECCIRNET